MLMRSCPLQLRSAQATLEQRKNILAQVIALPKDQTLSEEISRFEVTTRWGAFNTTHLLNTGGGKRKKEKEKKKGQWDR